MVEDEGADQIESLAHPVRFIQVHHPLEERPDGEIHARNAVFSAVPAPTEWRVRDEQGAIGQEGVRFAQEGLWLGMAVRQESEPCLHEFSTRCAEPLRLRKRQTAERTIEFGIPHRARSPVAQQVPDVRPLGEEGWRLTLQPILQREPSVAVERLDLVVQPSRRFFDQPWIVPGRPTLPTRPQRD